MEKSSIEERYRRTMESVLDAAQRAGRSSESIRLVAVTKYATIETMIAAYAVGIREFGENKVQDALPKLTALTHLAPRWHFIGHLQTNKVKHVVGAFELIHSVDTFKLAEALSREAVARRLVQAVLIQVDTSGETSKYGMAPEEVPEAIGRIARELPGVKVQGLMTMAPHATNPEVARPCFRKLRNLRDACNEDLPGTARLEHLSMGMTQDYKVAIEEGATLIRIGSGLFR